MKHFIYLLFFLTACETSNIEGKKADEQKLIKTEKEKVMAVHDFAMEKMGEMVKLKSSLKIKLSTLDSTQNEEYTIAINDLEAADKLMWDWMHGYKGEVVDTSSTEVALQYLKEQKIKVDIVDKKIKESLKNGYALLEK